MFSLEESQSMNIYKHWIITKQVMFVFGLYFFTYIWIEIMWHLGIDGTLMKLMKSLSRLDSPRAEKLPSVSILCRWIPACFLPCAEERGQHLPGTAAWVPSRQGGLLSSFREMNAFISEGVKRQLRVLVLVELCRAYAVIPSNSHL